MMYLTIVTLSCSWFAQTVIEAPLVPIQSAEHRTSPADMVAQGLTLPEGATLAGRPLTLLKALSAVPVGRSQLDVTHAYWRLAGAVAEYRIRWEQCERLRGIEAGPGEAAVLETARSSAAAALRVAEASALAAQHDLAEAAMLPATDPLPLPADRPHVGTYHTYFDEVFSARNPPVRTRLLDRSLPIRRRIIEVRASAVEAARDALEAATDAYGLRQVDLAEVLSSARQLAGQQRALWTAIGGYNHDIADYALSVAGPQSDEQVLVAMLIRPSHQSAHPSSTDGSSTERRAPGERQHTVASPSGVKRAALDAPLASPHADELQPAPPQGQLRSLGALTPTLAPPEEPQAPDSTVPPGSASVPPSAEPSAEAPSFPTEQAGDETVGAEETAREETAGEWEEAAEPWVVSAPAETEEPGHAEAVPEAEEPAKAEEPNQAEEPVEARGPEAPAATEPSGPTPRTANKPVTDPQGAPASTASQYPALVDAKPGVRAKLLSEELHRKGTLPEPAAEPAAQSVELKACLAGLSGADRRRLIEAYWLAAEKAAEYQVLAYQLNRLESLIATAFRRRDEPLGAEAMLQLRAAELAAQADLLHAELDLKDAQFELTRRAGRPLDRPWLLPVTIPHAGPYRLKLEAQPREVAESWPVRRLAAMIPSLCDGLEDRAAAVVQADTARAVATAGYESGRQPIGSVIASIQRQTEETLAFLETLTQYNQAIADYALAVLPSTTPAAQLAGALVVTR